MRGNGKFFAGVEYLDCNDLVSFANDRGADTDVCKLIQSYARGHCDCRDDENKPAPPLPFLQSTETCNFCGGNGGSDLWTILPTRSDTIVYTGIMIGSRPFLGKCGELWPAAMDPDGYFTKEQCPIIQNEMRTACGCAFRDASGRKIENTSGVGLSPTFNSTPSPTPRSPKEKTCVNRLNAVCSSNSPCCSGLKCGKKFGNGVRYCQRSSRQLRGKEEEPVGM